MALYCTLITKRNLHKIKGCNHHNANDRFGINKTPSPMSTQTDIGLSVGSIDMQVLACRMQCTARTDAVHCRGGCSALRERLQCTASEMENTGTEKASPILDKKLGRKDGSTRDTLGLPQDISAKPHYHHSSSIHHGLYDPYYSIPSFFPVSLRYQSKDTAVSIG